MKLLVCDVEGTIFKANYRIDGTEYASTMWQPLAARLGEAAIMEERDTHEKWEQGYYKGKYSAWVEDTIKIHKRYGLHKNTFYDLINEAEYHEGVEEFFQKIDRKKFIPVLVSGGFQELINRALKELDIKHGFGACEYFFDLNDGKLAGHNLKPCDFEGKYHYIENLFKDYNLTSKDWVFIGDGKNDVPIARKAPIKFGMRPIHPDLEKVVNHTVTDFREILSHLTLNEQIGESTTKAVPKKENDNINRNNDISVEEQLRKRVAFLEDQLKEKTREAKEANDRIYATQKITHNEITVLNEDYTDCPQVSLSGLLDNYKIVFTGLKEDYNNFQHLKNLHKNLHIITGSKKAFDTTPMEYADFIFTFKGCMGHPNSWKSEGARSKTPWSNLTRQNIDMLKNAMANVVIRHFGITSGGFHR